MCKYYTEMLVSYRGDLKRVSGGTSDTLCVYVLFVQADVKYKQNTRPHLNQ